MKSSGMMKKSDMLSKKLFSRAIRPAALLLFALLTLLPLCGCAKGPRVSDACVGYAAGRDRAVSARKADDRFPMPEEMTTALALYSAREVDDLSLFQHVVYNGAPVYLAALAEKSGGPAALLQKMRQSAEALGMSATTVAMISGNYEKEEAIFRSAGQESPDFVLNYTTLGDLFLLCRALCDCPAMRAVYGGYSVEFPEEAAPLVRDAPLLSPSSDLYLEETAIQICAWFDNPSLKKSDNRCCLTVAAVQNGEALGCAAVLSFTGNREARSYAAVDAGNLAAAAAGLNADLSYHPSDTPSGAGMRVGGGVFGAVILILLGAVVLLLLIVVLFGAISRMKRNVEGRKKYAPPPAVLSENEPKRETEKTESEAETENETKNENDDPK